MSLDFFKVMASLPAFTSGSIIFAGSNGMLTQNNKNLNWDNTNLKINSENLNLNESLTTIDSYTKLLLHFNGANAATLFLDSSQYHHAITPIGNAQISTAQSKFGGASGLFDGTGDYLTVPDSSDWYFGTGDFTLEGQMYITDNTHVCGLFYQQQDGDNRWGLYYDGSLNPPKLSFEEVTASVSTFYIATNWTPTNNTWYHVVAVRYGNNLYTFINGTLLASTAFNYTMSDFTGNLEIGRVNQTDAKCMIGSLDELRISKGIARWTANFTPPTAEYGTISVGDATYSGTSTFPGGGSRPIGGVPFANINFGTTTYLPLNGYAGGEFSEANAQFRLPAGLARKLRVTMTSNNINTGTSTLTLRVNGAGTALTVNIAAGVTTTQTDDTHTVTIAEDDLCCWQVVTSGASGSINFGTITAIF